MKLSLLGSNHSIRATGIVALVAATFVGVACADDPVNPDSSGGSGGTSSGTGGTSSGTGGSSSGTGGTAGNATGGSAGNATGGTAGKGGSTNTGGSTSGGSGGTNSSGGSAGDAGSGGVPGAGGDPSVGDGGDPSFAGAGGEGGTGEEPELCGGCVVLSVPAAEDGAYSTQIWFDDLVDVTEIDDAKVTVRVRVAQGNSGGFQAYVQDSSFNVAADGYAWNGIAALADGTWHDIDVSLKAAAEDTTYNEAEVQKLALQLTGPFSGPVVVEIDSVTSNVDGLGPFTFDDSIDPVHEVTDVSTIEGTLSHRP